MDNIREIPGYPGYYVSKDGKVYSSITHLNVHTYNDIPKIPNKLKELYVRVQTKHKNELNRVPYSFTTVKLNRYHKKFKVSRLVAMAWVPNLYPEEFNMVCHIDNNPLNNRADNLYWGNGKLNMTQCSMDGRLKSKPPHLVGEQVGTSKFSNRYINRIYRYIKRHHLIDKYRPEICMKFGITKSTFTKIKRGKHGGLYPQNKVPICLPPSTTT